MYRLNYKKSLTKGKRFLRFIRMKFSLPIFDDESNEIDRTTVILSQKDIQQLLDAICLEYEANQPGLTRQTAKELSILDDGE